MAAPAGPSVLPLLLAARVDLVQPAGRPGLLHLAQLRVRAPRLLLQLLQVNVNGVQVGLGCGDGQVAAVPGQTHAPAGARQVQLAVVHLHPLQLEVHHVWRLAHVDQQVPEDAAQDDAEQLAADRQGNISKKQPDSFESNSEQTDSLKRSQKQTEKGKTVLSTHTHPIQSLTTLNFSFSQKYLPAVHRKEVIRVRERGREAFTSLGSKASAGEASKARPRVASRFPIT